MKAALVDRYTIERELGRGGMATVYLAHDLKHHRQVAVKVLKPELAAALGPERFLREIEIAARLQHAHILPLFDSGEAAGLLYYVMPFVEGESLRGRLHRERQLPLEDALEIARQVANALDYAHGQAVVHRDIKPENILLSGGHALVVDFGIARAITVAGGEQLTATGVAVGTPSYMSPEQATGEPRLDGRSDIYSLGSVLYEMLAGLPPYGGSTAQAIIARRSVEPVPPVGRLRGDVPPAIDDVLAKALARRPDDRFYTAAQFAAALERARRLSVPAGPRRFLVPLSMAALLVVGVLAWLARESFPGRRARAPARPLLVVLPFENLGPPGDEYFADGITEEITSRLAQLSGLGVIARTSAIQYRGAHKSIRQIGQELGVAYVMEGSVRWEKPPRGPSRVRVNPQLIRVADATHVWAQPYDAVLADVFRVQGDIAGRVAQSLNVTLLAAESTAVASQPTNDLEAYDLFLRAEAYASRETQVDLRHAVELYQQAVERDPTFALAYAKLAFAYDQMYQRSDRTVPRLRQAQQAVDRALALQPALPEAHLAQGLVYVDAYRGYGRARREFALAPRHDALAAIGGIELKQGQWNAAVLDLAQAAALDPRDARLAVTLGWTYLLLRRYEEAGQVLERATEFSTNPEFYGARAWLELCRAGNMARARAIMREAASRRGMDTVVAELVALGPDHNTEFFRFLGDDYQLALEHLSLARTVAEPGDYFEAKAELASRQRESVRAAAQYDSARMAWEARLRTQPAEPYYHSMLGLALAGLGRKADAIREGRAAVARLPTSRDATGGPGFVFNLAKIYVLVGEPDEAIDQLAFLLTIPSWVSTPLLGVDPWWAPLRGNPRFERLLKGKA